MFAKGLSSKGIGQYAAATCNMHLLVTSGPRQQTIACLAGIEIEAAHGITRGMTHEDSGNAEGMRIVPR